MKTFKIEYRHRWIPKLSSSQPEPWQYSRKIVKATDMDAAIRGLPGIENNELEITAVYRLVAKAVAPTLRRLEVV